jgi:type II secretory pathway component HofQ
LTLPPLAAATIVTRDTVFVAQTVIAPTADPLAALGPTRRVTVHAVNADVRSLLVAVAKESGLDLIVSGDVRSRVSVALDDVPAAEALRAIIQSAGLAISGPGALGAIAAVTFYQLPVNVNTASAATIAARFGTSAELANFIVESRPQPPKTP